MTIEIITLACAGDCADVEAVAHGGNPPYAFTWEDGSTTAARRVCLDEGTTLEVTAVDTAINSEEFQYDPQTAVAEVTATVLACSDAGGLTPGGDFCIDNPSFEGTVGVLTFNAPPWNNCINQNPDAAPGFPSTPDLADSTNRPGTDGATYASMGWDPPLHEFITQKLCAPLVAGHDYSFVVDLATATDSLGTAYPPAQLAIYGSAQDCSRQELLWKSPPLDTAWTTYCVTLTPTQGAEYLTLEPTGMEQKTTFTLVDHIVPVEACP